MAVGETVGPEPGTQRAAADDRLGVTQERAYLALSVLLVAGLFVDAWSHRRGGTAESILSPWHWLMYAALAGQGLLLALVTLSRTTPGGSVRAAIPAGYGTAVAALLAFVAASPLDLAWHQLAGAESGIEVLVSPTHAVLFVAIAMLVYAPARGGDRSGWHAIVAVALVTSVASLVVLMAHPLVQPWTTLQGDALTLGVIGYLLQAAIVGGAIASAHRLWVSRMRPLPRGAGLLPPGATFLLVALPSVAMVLLASRLAMVPVVLGAAAAAEAILRIAESRRLPPAGLPLVAAAAVAAISAIILAATALRYEPDWSVHLSTGSVLLSGVTAWTVASLVTRD